MTAFDRTKPHESLFRKFILLVVPLTILSGLAIGLVMGLTGWRAFTRTIQADYRVAAVQAAKHIDYYLMDGLQEIETLAGLFSAVRLDQWRTRMALVELKHHYPQFQHIDVADDSGPQFENVLPNSDLPDREGLRTFREASRTERLAVSKVMLRNGVPIIFVAAPVMRDGRVSAVVWGRFDIKPVWDVIIQLKRDLNLGPDGHVYLTDPDRRLVAADQIAGRFGRVFDLKPASGRVEPPPADLRTWQEDQHFNTRDPEILKSLLDDRAVRADYWGDDTSGGKTIVLRTAVPSLSWTLYMTQPYREAFKFLYQGFWTSLGLTALVVAMGVWLTWVTVRRTLLPLKRLQAAVARASTGDLSEAIPALGRDEVGDLAVRFNDMQTALRAYIDRLVTATSDLNHAKSLAVLGTTASQVNHQVGNFLNNLRFALSILKNDKLSESSRASLAVIEDNTMQIQTFVERLLRFARKADLNLDPWDPARELERLISSHRERAVGQNAELTLSVEGGSMVLGDRALLEQALANILGNALEALDGPGLVAVRVGMEGGRVKIEIRDSGRGIPEEAVEQVFTPFFTTKKEKGTGLGLTLARTVIQAHGGEVALKSRLGAGATVTCWLPPAPPGPAGGDGVAE